MFTFCILVTVYYSISTLLDVNLNKYASNLNPIVMFPSLIIKLWQVVFVMSATGYKALLLYKVVSTFLHNQKY